MCINVFQTIWKCFVDLDYYACNYLKRENVKFEASNFPKSALSNFKHFVKIAQKIDISQIYSRSNYNKKNIYKNILIYNKTIEKVYPARKIRSSNYKIFLSYKTNNSLGNS